jgi:hypothetical protein
MRPTEKDIAQTRDGYYFLDCDGRHEPSWHKYLYYSKKQVLALWREAHPIKKEGN